MCCGDVVVNVGDSCEVVSITLDWLLRQVLLHLLFVAALLVVHHVAASVGVPCLFESFWVCLNRV